MFKAQSVAETARGHGMTNPRGSRYRNHFTLLLCLMIPLLFSIICDFLCCYKIACAAASQENVNSAQDKSVIPAERAFATLSEGSPKPLQGGAQKFGVSGVGSHFKLFGKSREARVDSSFEQSVSPARLWLSETHPEFGLKDLASLASQILIIAGDGGDRVDLLLEEYGIPFTFLKYRPLRLDGFKLVILTCDTHSHGTEADSQIQRWVADGGFLITTGWSTSRLADYIPGYFKPGPKFLYHHEPHCSLEEILFSRFDEEITAKQDMFFAGADSPLVSANPWTPTCNTTCSIEVTDPTKDNILMTSRSLATKDKGQGLLAGCFSVGRGKVLHYTAHLCERIQPICREYGTSEVGLYKWLRKHYRMSDADVYKLTEENAPPYVVEPHEIMAINFILEALSVK